MKKTLVILGVIIALIITGVLVLNNKTTAPRKIIYYRNPMDPAITSPVPIKDQMGMDYVPVYEEATPTKSGQEAGQGKILYYRNPMDPAITSPVPMKDQMGMDYTPVYEEETNRQDGGIYVSPEKQQILKIKKELVEKRSLIKDIKTVGKIAYDPELFIAQQEYLEALKAKQKMEFSPVALVKEQTDSILQAARRKLILLGMSEQEIEDLAKRGQPQENLYMPLKADTVCVYMPIYEYEIGLIKEGLAIEVETLAFPGEIFKGKIRAITPILDPATRSVQVRAEIENPEHKLKPEMFVNVTINIDLGEKLTVPEEAVMDTGERQIVFVAKPDGYFESRQVKLGNKSQNYYEVLSGVSEGEEVVSSGNFFIDSESRLKSAVNN
ncbi:MAG: efflux RND transporter periplasmic adaptor subunit [bacterium]